MKAKLKLCLRRMALRWLRKLVDLADDRLHAAEVRFRDQNALPGVLNGSRVLAPSGTMIHDPSGNARIENRTSVRRTGQGLPAKHSRETFQQWEARRSGVAVMSKKSLRQAAERNDRPRRAVTAAAFDARFAQ